MRRPRLGRRAVAGFFEEIPAALVAIVALLLFFTAVLVGLNGYLQRQATATFDAQAETFLEELTGYANLTCGWGDGVYDSGCVQTLTIVNLTWTFHPQYQYFVEVTDISTYAAHYNNEWQTAALPADLNSLRIGEVKDSTSIDIHAWITPPFGPPIPTDHAAILTVVIWE